MNRHCHVRLSCSCLNCLYRYDLRFRRCSQASGGFAEPPTAQEYPESGKFRRSKDTLDLISVSLELGLI